MPRVTVLQAVGGHWRTKCKEASDVDPRTSSKPKGKVAGSSGSSRQKFGQICAVE